MAYPLLRRTIVSFLPKDYSWMNLGDLSKELKSNGIDYKELGFDKATHLIHQLKGFVDIKFEKSLIGQQCLVRKNPEQRASEFRNILWNATELRFKAINEKSTQNYNRPTKQVVEKRKVNLSRRTHVLKPTNNNSTPNYNNYSSSRYPISTSQSLWLIYTPMGNGMR